MKISPNHRIFKSKLQKILTWLRKMVFHSDINDIISLKICWKIPNNMTFFFFCSLVLLSISPPPLSHIFSQKMFNFSKIREKCSKMQDSAADFQIRSKSVKSVEKSQKRKKIWASGSCDFINLKTSISTFVYISTNIKFIYKKNNMSYKENQKK